MVASMAASAAATVKMKKNKDSDPQRPRDSGRTQWVHIDGEQDQPDGHQQNDQILAIVEDPDDTDGKQYRPENR